MLSLKVIYHGGTFGILNHLLVAGKKSEREGKGGDL
jgi:hypothetical protein